MSKVGTVLLSQYGVLGLIVFCMALYILKKEKDHATFIVNKEAAHAAERKEMVAALKENNDKMLVAFDRNTTVLTEVRTLIETIARK